MKKRLGFIEWMQHIHHTNQTPSGIARGLDRLSWSQPSQPPSGVKKPSETF